ncbi:zinc ribbon domain-containing protein [Paenibacillus sp. GD4]|uniref:zinc ribbon domain-containing protein n=1 Tax=Paenibacillus sp. GD4 TaxID=3068890 RepID=UPI0027968749|nr:zinc ribbon domain-containing protein [Paenibacillus sp. GD4]MDQ1912153.1 zinc ribbon domain-containing protein [Paenibacillus sp. GD4]
MGALLSLLLFAVVVIVIMLILHYVIYSAINDSKLTRSVQEMQVTIEKMQQALERLSPPPQASPQTRDDSPQQWPDRETCPACFTPISAEDKECPDCGLSLRENTESP